MFIVSIPYHPSLPLLREVGSGARLYITHHTKRCIEVRPWMYLLNKLEFFNLYVLQFAVSRVQTIIVLSQVCIL